MQAVLCTGQTRTCVELGGSAEVNAQHKVSASIAEAAPARVNIADGGVDPERRLRADVHLFLERAERQRERPQRQLV